MLIRRHFSVRSALGMKYGWRRSVPGCCRSGGLSRTHLCGEPQVAQCPGPATDPPPERGSKLRLDPVLESTRRPRHPLDVPGGFRVVASQLAHAADALRGAAEVAARAPRARTELGWIDQPGGQPLWADQFDPLSPSGFHKFFGRAAADQSDPAQARSSPSLLILTPELRPVCRTDHTDRPSPSPRWSQPASGARRNMVIGPFADPGGARYTW